MRTSILRLCTILAFGWAASQTLLVAQDNNGNLAGVWDVSVTVVNCQTGAPIRTVRALQLYRHDGTFIETANTASRGISEGVWKPAGDQTYSAAYWFFRYKPDGTFASFARAANIVTFTGGDHFTASGLIKDYDASGALLSTGCVTHSATRLTTGDADQGHDN